MFLSWQHSVSKRHAILEEAGGMVWLYLTGPNSTKPEGHCPAFATQPLADTIDWKVIEKTGAPPSITKDIASATAIIEHAKGSELSPMWSANGESVALIRGGEILCMIVAGAEQGYSRAIATPGPLGLPFDDVVAGKTFPTQRP
jgi:hypothetical protein